MKKLGILLLLLALLLSLGASAWAEEGVEVEVITADGESIVVVTPKASFADVSFGTADFTLPAGLLTIEEEAFAGISAQRVEVSWNVGAIGPRAFADCPNLLAISIPDTVTSIDDSALAGCGSVTVFGPSRSRTAKRKCGKVGKYPRFPYAFFAFFPTPLNRALICATQSASDS